MLVAAIRKIIDFFEQKVLEVVPETRPGDAFKATRGTKPLSMMPKTAKFNRSVQVKSAKNFGPVVSYLPLHRTVTVLVQVGYLARMDDLELEQWMDEDEEGIATSLFSESTTGWPDALNLIESGGAPFIEDVSDGEAEAVVVSYPYEIQYFTE